MLIIKLGGSVIQENLDKVNPKVFDFVKRVLTFDTKVCVTVGGGPICRLFQNSLRDFGYDDTENLHKVGMRALSLQAEFVKSIFPKAETFPELIEGDDLLRKATNAKDDYKYFIAGAWNPGHSTDYNSTLTAISFTAPKVLRISNVDYVYDSDPNKNPDAKMIKEVSWDEYLNIIGNPKEHVPGASYPVDPLASRICKDEGIKFYMTSLNKFLQTEGEVDFANFEGSIIG